jgi:hypothetical protein
MTTRDKALLWWIGLDNMQQRTLWEFVSLSNMPFSEFSASSSKIESLFCKIFNIESNAANEPRSDSK